MGRTVNIDRAGRVVIPKEVRDSLQLRPGDALEIETSPDEQITLRPLRPGARMVREEGIWVCYTGSDASDVDIVRLIDEMREERIQSLIG